MITELELRDRFRQAPFTSFELPAGTRLTPAAVQFLNERKISLIQPSSSPPPAAQTAARSGGPSASGSPRQLNNAVPETTPTGNAGSQPATGKQEYQTHLHGNQLVTKNHPRIKLRGRIDHLEAETILAILEARNAGLPALASDLQWFLDLQRQILKAEVTGAALPEISFGELSGQQIREYSHHPEKHIGVRHFMPEARHGQMMARLNLLRTLVRQVELVAVEAFCRPEGVERQDILTALNRASSAVYIMMCRLLAGHYYRPGD
ncbi:MAG: hypothetical protein ACOY81_12145 [Bacillota bacterium]|uniref:hypothetical protein n=1 Tax=Desulfurispora thermophila TaxID=265470 RepID=UPI001FA7F56C|nr:hypothetical protein [Desulfurispora thermophila]